MSAALFDLTGDFCVLRGEPLFFSADFSDNFNVTGAIFDSYIERNFDKTRIADFEHSITNTGLGIVSYTLPASTTSGLDYAASSFKSFVYPSGESPILLMTGNVNVNI